MESTGKLFFTFIKAVIRHNTKANFSWEAEKMNVKFHKNCENTGIIF